MTHTAGGNTRDLLVTLAYLPYDSDIPPPSKGLRKVTDYCSTNKMQLVTGCDANADYITWGSMDIKPQGEYLMECLISKKTEFLNPGNEPNTISDREVTDMTPGTDKVGDLV